MFSALKSQIYPGSELFVQQDGLSGVILLKVFLRTILLKVFLRTILSLKCYVRK